MRIQLDFDKKIRSKSLLALERFVNFYLIGIDHGLTFEAVFITFIEKPKKDQTFKRRFLYKKYADISVPGTFADYESLNLEDFRTGFKAVKNSIKFVKEILVEGIDFNEGKLEEDINSLESLIPKTEDELKYWYYNKDELDRQIHLKRMECRDQQRKENLKPLLKPVKGIRIYDKKEDLNLRPYLNFVSCLLANQIKAKNLLSPGYKEIYFSISDSLNDARTEFPLEDWHEYAYATLDYNKFWQSEEKDRIELLYNSLVIALRDLAALDNLDNQSMELIIKDLSKEIKEITNLPNFKEIAETLKMNNSGEKILMNQK